MAISKAALKAGHKYASSRITGAVWCYAHEVPTDLCDFDCEWTGDCEEGCEHDEQ